jgi:hypothetical protein
MQSTNMRRMKAAIWNQAFTGRAQMWCPMGSVVAKRREKRATPGNGTRVGLLVSALRVSELGMQAAISPVHKR